MRSLISRLSPKAIFLGAFVDVASSFTLGLALVVYIMLRYDLHFNVGTQAQLVQSLAEAFHTDPFVLIANWGIGALLTVLGGYITAQISKKHIFLNAAFEPFWWIGSSIFSLFAASSASDILIALLCIPLNLLLAISGAYVYQKYGQRYEKFNALKFGIVIIFVLFFAVISALFYDIHAKPTGGLIKDTTSSLLPYEAVASR